MSTQEVAEGMNAYLWEEHLKKPGSAAPTILDHRFVSAYENGRFWWPSQHYRAAFRHVLRVETDADLGFRRSRGRIRPAPGAEASPALEGRPNEAVGGQALHAGRGLGQGGRTSIDVTSTDDERAYELFLRGYGLLAANDRREIETAQDLLERAVGRNPRFARAIAARGYTRWRQYFAGWATNAHALKNALRDVDAALDADPDSVFAHMTFIRTCWDLGWHEQALQAGKSIYEKNPESLDATVAFARALNNAGLAQFALPLVDSVLAGDITNPAALKLRVWCRLMVGDHTYVLRVADEYLAKHPTDANTRWAVALACQNSPGEGDRAIRIARDALDGDPADATLWVLLGYLHRLNGDEASARGAWSRGLERLKAEAPDASNWRRKAWVANAQAAMGDSESALRAVHELSEADPENGYLRYRLGHVLAEIGHTGEAVRMLESAVNRGFLSLQLLRQEEVLGLSRLRSLDDYAVVVQRLEASVEQCRRTYAAHLPAAIRTIETATRDVETIR
jgi:tetratricopeptide (TPR) repeat protein